MSLRRCRYALKSVLKKGGMGMRTLSPKEVAIIRPQPAVMINHGEVSAPAPSGIQPATRSK